MEKLECIIVHGSMSSVSLSLDTRMICTILLMFMMERLFANQVDYYKLLNKQTMIGDHVYVFLAFFGPNLEEKEEGQKRSIFACAQAIFVYGGHIPHT